MRLLGNVLVLSLLLAALLLAACGDEEGPATTPAAGVEAGECAPEERPTAKEFRFKRAVTVLERR